MQNTVDNIQENVSDIGVKHEQKSHLRTAGGEEIGKAPDTSYAEELPENAMPAAKEDELHTEIPSDEQLETEFEELIRTRYKNAYHKRTEGLIRKRLRSVKKQEQNEAGTDRSEQMLKSQALRNGEKKKLQLEENKSRPTENGVGTSVGIYSRANVSKFTGKEIRDILKRADRGEKIRFD